MKIITVNDPVKLYSGCKLTPSQDHHYFYQYFTIIVHIYLFQVNRAALASTQSELLLNEKQIALRDVDITCSLYTVGESYYTSWSCLSEHGSCSPLEMK
jgi:hypothetical protein